MNIVEPIRDLKKINAMKNYLKGKNIRDYACGVCSIDVKGGKIGTNRNIDK